eukprot:TRINITY_DN1403_c0_g1_i2.p1 TRINITY_DN1403_c0_g1~~TRINITY_DN1403_c0_g1_i2.p1  ORF type:complete len:330 (+),score=142.67 TRINITY_DN1403_c0_g1_i2:46-1035(+)
MKSLLSAVVLLCVVGSVLCEEAATTTTEKKEVKYSGTWLESVMSSWFMILVSEIGDKTFFIACLMAMRNDRLTVFLGAMSALGAMTILSAAMGHIVPTLLPVKYTQMAAVILFTVFGVRLLNEARTMQEDEGDDEPEELQEAKAELGEDKKDDDIENGVEPATAQKKRSYTRAASLLGPVFVQAFTLTFVAELGEDKKDDDIENGVEPATAQKKRSYTRAASLLGPVFVQAFTLTFVAEWGDRSQIATIMLAAAKNPYGVTLGGVLGHSVCTGSAVLIGRGVSNTFTPKHVTTFGGLLFVFFGILTAYQLVYEHPDAVHNAAKDIAGTA